MCYHTHSSPNESIDCVVRCKIYRFIRRGMCVITQSFLIWYQRIDSLSCEQMWTKSIDSCGEKGNFYKFFPHTLRSTKSIDSFGGNGDFFFQVAKYGFFMAIFWPSNWPFCRNFWARRCSFPQILWLSKKTCLRKWCEFYRFIWFHWPLTTSYERNSI